MNIDDKTSIPLSWFIFSISSIVISVSIGSFWIKSVNDRLSRIEEKLGIPPLVDNSISMEAHAEEK